MLWYCYMIPYMIWHMISLGCVPSQSAPPPPPAAPAAAAVSLLRFLVSAARILLSLRRRWLGIQQHLTPPVSDAPTTWTMHSKYKWNNWHNWHKYKWHNWHNWHNKHKKYKNEKNTHCGSLPYIKFNSIQGSSLSAEIISSKTTGHYIWYDK